MRWPLTPLLLLMACASTPQRAAPLEPDARGEVEVAQWTLGGPFPAAEQVGAPMDLVAGGTRVRMTAAMGCVARELGRFVAAHDGPPELSVRSLIAARCGAARATWSMHWRRLKHPDEARGLLERARSLDRPVELGAAFVEERFVVVWDAPLVHLSQATVVPDSFNKVRFAGQLLRPADRLLAVVTRGSAEVTPCAIDLDPPRFSFACQVDPSDTHARVQLIALRADRFLNEVAIDFVVWPAGKAARTHIAPPKPPRRGRGAHG